MDDSFVYYFQRYLFFWGIPGVIALVSFFVIGKTKARRIAWLCIFAALVAYNILCWKNLQATLAATSGNAGMSASIGYTTTSNVEALLLLFIAVLWRVICPPKKTMKSSAARTS